MSGAVPDAWQMQNIVYAKIVCTKILIEIDASKSFILQFNWNT